ncbi:MAG: ABC transporter substrate-binding protein [Patescibacteria group bacterium]|nr:ABC transporter substrate-binding protein [Patescibacteria group bacterium]
MKKIGWILILLLALVAIAAVWQNQKPAQSSSALTIGAIFPLTGANATYGEMAQKGIALALKNLPEHIKVVYEDDQFQSAPALSAYEKLKAAGVKVFFTIGSQVSSTIGPEAVKDGLMNFELTAVTPKYADGSPLTCRAALTVEPSAEVLYGYIQKHHLERIALFVTNDAQGAAYDSALTRMTASTSAHIVDRERYTLNENDFRSEISRIEAAHPDALVLISPGQQAEEILTQLHQLNFKGKILSNNWTIENAALKNLSLANGTVFSDYSYGAATSSADSAAVSMFKNEFAAAYGDAQPPVVAATAYDAVTLIATAVGNGLTGPAAISNFVSNTKNFQGISGTWSFNADCEAAQSATLRTVQNGTIVPLQN